MCFSNLRCHIYFKCLSTIILIKLLRKSRLAIFSITDKVNLNLTASNEQQQILKEIVCYNQGKIAEYMYMQQSYSTKLSNEFSELFQNAKKENVDNLENILKEYKTKSINFLETCINKNLEYIQQSFLKRHTDNPRGCVKLLSPELKLIDAYRNQKTKPYKYTENTGFYQIIDNKEKYYLNNNIPEAVKNARYKNHRIDTKAAKNYTTTISNKFSKIRKKSYVDQEWINCWNSYEQKHQPQNNECYKSTLIIPMTLINNELSSDFKMDFFQKQETKDKTILGFVCLDHLEIDYFNINDANIGFIIADLLSIYFIIDYKMRNHNENYTSTTHLLNEINKLKDVELFLNQIQGTAFEN